MPQSRPTLAVAMIGHAFMGAAHSQAWRTAPRFFDLPLTPAMNVVAGRDLGRVTAAAERLGWAEAATDWRAVVDRDDIDLVDICLPGHLHAEVTIAALEVGKHVLVEKPLANTVTEAEKMLLAARSARERGAVSMVGFNYRRVPALAMARDLVASGRLGDVRQVKVSYLQDWLADADAPMTWRLRKQTAGSGALGDLASHAADQVRFLLGHDIVSVSGSTETFVRRRMGADGPEDVTVDDAAWATLRTSGGAVASLEVTRMATGRKNSLTIEVYGSEGALAFDLERLNELSVCTDPGAGFTRMLVTEAEQPYVGAWWPPGHVLGWDHTFTSQAADFLSAIGSGADPSPSFADGLAVQRVLAAIEESGARSGQQIDLRTEGVS